MEMIGAKSMGYNLWSYTVYFTLLLLARVLRACCVECEIYAGAWVISVSERGHVQVCTVCLNFEHYIEARPLKLGRADSLCYTTNGTRPEWMLTRVAREYSVE